MPYHCPDCDRIHDDPYEAAFTLLARCLDCGMAAEFYVPRTPELPVPRAA